jgi:hypothetical protein
MFNIQRQLRKGSQGPIKENGQTSGNQDHQKVSRSLLRQKMNEE